MTQADPSPAVPENIGRYRILKLIARGSFGVVYLAHDPLFEEDVAIKLCQPEEEVDEQQARVIRKLFFNEIKSNGRLVHPNIVGLRDANEVDGVPYLVMEYVPGGTTLRAFCSPNSLLPIRDVAKLIHSCARALDHAHKRGIVHRDIKPENVMLTPHREVKIGDFGVAKREVSQDTEVAAVLGSPRYMSPEQMDGEAISASTDLYSLGVVLYELLTGRAPFDATNVGRLVNQVLNETPRAPSNYRSELSQEVDDLVRRLLSKAPADRHPSGQALADDLVEVFGNVASSSDWLEDESKFQLARASAFFSDFAETELWELVRLAGWQHYRARDEVAREGGLELSFQIVLSGRLEVLRGTKQVALLSRGDCFGECGFVGRAEATSSVVASGETIILSVDSRTIEHASVDCRLRFNDAFIRTLIMRLSVAARPALDVNLEVAQALTAAAQPLDLELQAGTEDGADARPGEAEPVADPGGETLLDPDIETPVPAGQIYRFR